MDTNKVAGCLEALGHPMRLEILRRLVQTFPQGTSVGTLREATNLPASTLSHHIKTLVRIGLIQQVRQSRTLICQPDLVTIKALVTALNREFRVGLL